MRLQTSLSSATAQPEQRFEATTAVDLAQGGRVLVPAGPATRFPHERGSYVVAASSYRYSTCERTAPLSPAIFGFVDSMT